MARIRTIKPEFFRHEGLAELSPLHRLLFQGLWVIADRNGRLKDRPARIKAEILPYDSCNVDAMLDELETHDERFIVRYAMDGEKFIQITNFLTHQRPHPKEPSSAIPAPSDTVKRKKSRTSTVTHGSSIHHASVKSESCNTTQSGSNPLLTESLDKGSLLINGDPGRMDDPTAMEAMTIDRVVRAWNAIPQVRKTDTVTGPVRERLRIRIREHPNPSWWKEIFERVGRSDFLCGRVNDFTATLHWILGPQNLSKLLAGNYDNRDGPKDGAWFERFVNGGKEAHA